MVEQVGEGIWVVRAGAIVANCYILDAGRGRAALVDAGMDGAAVDAALQALGRVPTAIYCTHGHFDHVGGAKHLADRHGIAVHLPRPDLRVARTNNALLMLMRRSERVELPTFTAVDDGFAADVGGDRLSYRHTPGHTPGSSMLLWRDALFTGDTMYARGMGLAQRPNEDLAGIRRSISTMWPDVLARTIHPGHGPSEKGSIVAERNAALRSFLAEEAA